MTTELATTDIRRAGRRRVARTRGAASGFLVVLVGLWAAFIPFVGPLFDVGFTPSPGTTWVWTGGRGVFDVLPGAVAVVGGLLLLASTRRMMAIAGGWLAALSGAWLIVGPQLAEVMTISAGRPDPAHGPGVRAADALLFFYGTGAAILLLAALALGRLSVVGVRDVRAAERRAAAELEAERAIAERYHEPVTPPPSTATGWPPPATSGYQPPPPPYTGYAPPPLSDETPGRHGLDSENRPVITG